MNTSSVESAQKVMSWLSKENVIESDQRKVKNSAQEDFSMILSTLTQPRNADLALQDVPPVKTLLHASSVSTASASTKENVPDLQNSVFQVKGSNPETSHFAMTSLQRTVFMVMVQTASSVNKDTTQNTS